MANFIRIKNSIINADEVTKVVPTTCGLRPGGSRIRHGISVHIKRDDSPSLFVYESQEEMMEELERIWAMLRNF